MGTLTTTIKLNDQFSKQLRDINNKIKRTIQLAERMNRATGSKNTTAILNQEIKLKQKEIELTKLQSKLEESSNKRQEAHASKMAQIYERGVQNRLNLEKKLELQEKNRMAAASRSSMAAARKAGILAGLNVNGYTNPEDIYKGINRKKEMEANIKAREQAAAKVAREEAKVAREAEKSARAAEKKRLAEERSAKALAQQQGFYNRLQTIASRIRNIMTLVGTATIIGRGMGSIVRLSDQMTMTDAKLNLVAGGDKKLKNELEAKTFAAAQRSTTDYMEFSKSVGKLGVLAGDKFKNNDSIVKFVELMNKSFQISGAETSERNAAMLQITQAIASNRLQGDEFRSILENAPMVMDALTKSLGIGQGELKAMAKEGKITADVLIKAMFDAGDKIEEMYKTLPMTWERHWAKMKNVGVMAFKPIQEQFKRLFGSTQFQAFINGICNSLIVLGNVGGWAFKTLFSLLGKISGLFERFPILLTLLNGVFVGLSVALGVFLTAQLIGLGKAIIGWILATKEAFMYQLALFKMAVAQHGFNAALAMCPLTWVLYAIIAVITVIYLAVAAFNHFAKTSISATGIIAGAVMWLGAVILDVIVAVAWIIAQILDIVVNRVIKVCEIIYNAFNGGFTDWIGGVQSIFGDFITWILAKIKPLVELWDKFKGTNYAATISGWQEKASSWGGKTSSYKKFDQVNMSGWVAQGFVNPNNAYSKGYKWGSNLETSIGDLTKVTLNGQKLNAEALNGINNKLGDIGANTGDTAKNTGDTAKNTSSEQDYSYLRDWSYRAGMGGSIGYNIKIEQNNRNSVASHFDLDKIADALIDKFMEGLNIQGEGVR